MAQQTQSDSRETVPFGDVDVATEQPGSNDSPRDSQPSVGSSSSAVEETLSTNQSQQNEQRVVNYGPCILCNVHKSCTLFVGCNHLACCGRCSETCGDLCPVPNCNHPIRERLHVFEPRQ